MDDLRPEKKKWPFNFYISFPFSATWFLFSCTWHHTEIQNNSILQFLLPFLLPSLTSCPVAFWLVLCWFWLLWGSHGLDIFQSCPWRVMVATLIDSSLEQAPQDRLPPYLGVWLPSWVGMPGCNWFIHKSGLSAQRKALSLPYPSQTVSAYL